MLNANEMTDMRATFEATEPENELGVPAMENLDNVRDADLESVRTERNTSMQLNYESEVEVSGNESTTQDASVQTTHGLLVLDGNENDEGDVDEANQENTMEFIPRSPSSTLSVVSVNTIGEPGETSSSSNQALPNNQVNRMRRKPTTQVMVDAAILFYNKRNGSSFIAIKKYILQTYPIENVDSLQRNIKRYLKQSVETNRIIKKKASYKLSNKTISQQRRDIKMKETMMAKKAQEKAKRARAKQTAAKRVAAKRAAARRARARRAAGRT